MPSAQRQPCRELKAVTRPLMGPSPNLRPPVMTPSPRHLQSPVAGRWCKSVPDPVSEPSKWELFGDNNGYHNYCEVISLSRDEGQNLWGF